MEQKMLTETKLKEEGKVKKTRILIICLSWLLLLVTSASAIDLTGKWGLWGNGGLWKQMMTDRSDFWTLGYFGSGGLKYGLTRNVAVGVTGYYMLNSIADSSKWPNDAKFSFDKLDGGFKQSNILVEAMIFYHFMPDKKVTPYVFGGPGIYIWKWKDKDGNTVRTNDFDNPPYDSLRGSIPDSGTTVGGNTIDENYELKDKEITFVGGIGVEWFPTENLSLNIGGKFHYLSHLLTDFKGNLDIVGKDSGQLDLPQGIVEGFVGLTYYFGAPKDADKDGVADKLDQCMDTPLGCIVDANGCQLDADGDGVCDGLDKCPETPKGAKVDANGCPTDADGDKVYDGIDQCASTPAGVKVDSRGCPLDTDSDGVPDHLDKQAATTKGCTVDKDGVAMDSDGDGVCDGIDKCTGTPAGVEVDAMGCAVPSKYIPEPQKPVVLEGVTFESNKARLTPNAMTVLDMVAASLIKRKDVKVEVAGHTDSQGSDAYNHKLSHQRAEVVREYLIGKGVPAENLTFKGYGEASPIASNDTKEGREQNRRVELIRIQ